MSNFKPPANITTKHWNDGKHAYRQGKLIHVNPHVAGSYEHRQWRFGYLAEQIFDGDESARAAERKAKLITALTTNPKDAPGRFVTFKSERRDKANT